MFACFFDPLGFRAISWSRNVRPWEIHFSLVLSLSGNVLKVGPAGKSERLRAYIRSATLTFPSDTGLPFTRGLPCLRWSGSSCGGQTGVKSPPSGVGFCPSLPARGGCTRPGREAAGALATSADRVGNASPGRAPAGSLGAAAGRRALPGRSSATRLLAGGLGALIIVFGRLGRYSLAILPCRGGPRGQQLEAFERLAFNWEDRRRRRRSNSTHKVE